MALADYTDLKAAVASWMNRTDLTSAIPDFIALAEGRIARDMRLRSQVTETTLSTVANTQTVALPADIVEIENISVVANPNRPLSVITPEQMDFKYPDAFWTSQPSHFSIIGSTLYLGPTPDAVYSLHLAYYGRITALATTATNALLTSHPIIYLAASLSEGYLYLKDTDAAALWNDRYRSAKDSLQQSDDSLLRSGSQMRVRAL